MTLITWIDERDQAKVLFGQSVPHTPRKMLPMSTVRLAMRRQAPPG